MMIVIYVVQDLVLQCVKGNKWYDAFLLVIARL